MTSNQSQLPQRPVPDAAHRGLCVTGLLLLSGLCGGALYALEDPGLSGGTAFAEWEAFSDASGGDNSPDAGLGGSAGFAVSPVLRQDNPDSGAFITSSGNIYSFSGISRFAIDGRFAGELNNFVLQFTTFGAEIDYTSILFRYGPDFGNSLAPTTAAPTATAEGEVSYLAQWDLSSLGGLNEPFRIAFDASGTSVSLAAARIDASDTFNDVAPPPPILQNETEHLAYAGEPIAIQLEASGAPFVYSATGLPSWLSLNNSTGLITGSVPEGTAGEFVFTVTAFNGQNSDPLELNLTTVLPQSYSEWASAGGLDPGNDAATADPDGDSLTNLEEYFYGSDPLSADAPDAIQSLAHVREPGQPDRLVLTFNWNRRAADVNARPEYAAADFVWVSDAPGTQLSFFTDGTGEVSLVTEDSDSGFLRLNLSLQP
ncbi:MAG: Ig domain-containing protein [Opitutales bacterium]